VAGPHPEHVTERVKEFNKENKKDIYVYVNVYIYG
jgi:hypothetical protein